ncbi:hypothetical protein KCU61_g249, partial [Aureobasidium melanogenum]
MRRPEAWFCASFVHAIRRHESRRITETILELRDSDARECKTIVQRQIQQGKPSSRLGRSLHFRNPCRGSRPLGKDSSPSIDIF